MNCIHDVESVVCEAAAICLHTSSSSSARVQHRTGVAVKWQLNLLAHPRQQNYPGSNFGLFRDILCFVNIFCVYLMWREVQPMGFVTNYCLHPGLQALLAFSSRREALTPIGAVEVLGDFDLAAGPHV